jgi:peroxiredoxin
VAASPPVCDFGWRAPDFHLRAPDGQKITLGDIAGPKGTLVMFLCNHCPYVISALDRILRDTTDLMALGVGVVAISPSDIVTYPQDGPGPMAELAARHGFPFPYLFDETQAVAHAYGAACTPDFFGFNADLALQYRGRLDAGGRTAVPGARRELYEAMVQVVRTGYGPAEQIPSMGCSIKWKADK